MSKEKQPLRTVHLRVFKGTEILKRANGEVSNENQGVKLPYETFEWRNFMDNLINLGFCKVEVERILVDGKEDNSEKHKIQAQVDAKMKPAAVELTPDQKRIAELEAKIEKLIGKDSDDEELKAARDEYKELFGKKGSPAWTAEEIREKIAEDKAVK